MNYIVDLSNKFQIDIIFIMETKANFDRSNARLNQVPLPNRFIVPATGLKGGLWLAWALDIDVKIINSSHHHIEAEMATPNGNKIYKTFFIHAPSNVKDRPGFWSELASSTK